MRKVLITLAEFNETGGNEATWFLQSHGCEPVYEIILPGQEDRLSPHLASLEAAIIGGELWSQERMSRTCRLKILARFGTGYDQVDVEAATRQGIFVTNTPGAMAVSVAEYAFALMLGLFKRLLYNNSVARSGQWTRPVSSELYGKTLGIVGMGYIGKEMILRAKAFGMIIAAHDPAWDEEFASRYDVRRLDLDELLSLADCVSIHVPLMPGTRAFFSSRHFERMKPTAFLINTSRGAVVDESALVEALSGGRIAGAGLDVLTEEPPRVNNPLLTMENVILSPHSSANTPEAKSAMGLQAARNVVEALNGEIPENLLNRDVLQCKEQEKG